MKCCTICSLFKGNIQDIEETDLSGNKKNISAGLSRDERLSAKVFLKDNCGDKYQSLSCVQTTNS